jgi:hypothetical protein
MIDILVIVSSFGCLLYEMATGYEIPTPRKGRVELHITDPSLESVIICPVPFCVNSSFMLVECHRGVVDILDKIFHTTDHTVTCKRCLFSALVRI